MARTNLEDAIKFGSAMILLLVVILTISVVTVNIDKTPDVLKFLIYLMLILSIITAIGNFLKKNLK